MFRWGDDTDEIKKRLLAHKDRPPEKLIPFGISYLDDAFGGIIKTDCVVLSSWTGVGKTEMAAQIAFNASTAGFRVRMYGLEHEKDEIQNRNVYKKLKKFQTTKIWFDYQDFISGQKKQLWIEHYEQAVNETLEELKNLTVVYPYEETDKEFNQASLEAEILAKANETDLFIIDHLHFLQIDGADYLQQMDKLMRTIGRLIKVLKKPVILICQLRKANDFNRPLLPSIDDILGASQIKNTATKVILFGRDNYSNEPGSALIHAAKNRHRGAVVAYVAKLKYDFQTNKYTSKYFLVKIKSNQKEYDYVSLDNIPEWAVNALSPTSSAPNKGVW